MAPSNFFKSSSHNYLAVILLHEMRKFKILLFYYYKIIAILFYGIEFGN